MSLPAIQLKQLTKCFAGTVVVRALNLDIAAGTIYGFFGPNGAGKSATVRMMVGLLRPDEGEALLLGERVTADAIELKRKLGVVPDNLALFEMLSISEHLHLVGALYELDAKLAEQRGQELLDMLDLMGSAQKLARECSYGMRKKIALAMALLPNPRILILDEPFEGLDPVMCVTVKRALKRAASRGTTVFLTTHVLHSIEGLVDRFGILRAGDLVAEADVAALVRSGRTLEEFYMSEFPVPKKESLEWLG